MVEFGKLYRKCSRACKLKGSESELQEFIGADVIVNEVTINIGRQIDGFRILSHNKSAFFPKGNPSELCPDQLTYVAKLREKLNKVTVVVPSLVSTQELDEFSKAIHSDTQNTGELMGKWYPTEFIARLYCCYYQNNSLTEKYLKIIKCSIEAFHFGLYPASIISLIPCIEGIIRDIGMKIDINCGDSVSVSDLLNILDKLKKRIINNFIFRDYDWVPVDYKSVKLHDQFNEIVQAIESLKFVIKNDYYAHTDSYSNEINLNRNGIVHGFITDFDDKSNFYRLLTILNSLVMFSGYIGELVSLIPPKHSDESILYSKKLNNIKLLGIAVENA